MAPIVYGSRILAHGTPNAIRTITRTGSSEGGILDDFRISIVFDCEHPTTPDRE